jgi:hypothetical protein
LGDLNINVLKYDSNQLAQDYVDLLFSYGLLQVITKPTHLSNTSATLIDHVITAPKSNFCNSAILTSRLSDHFPIIYILDSPKIRACEKFVTFRDYSQANMSKALNNKEHSIAIFCDLRKAFDSCDHEILLWKLSGVGIRGKKKLFIE